MAVVIKLRIHSTKRDNRPFGHWLDLRLGISEDLIHEAELSRFHRNHCPNEARRDSVEAHNIGVRRNLFRKRSA
jgi:hypothetical protein